MDGIDPVIIISLVGGVLVALAGYFKGNSVATSAIEALQSVMDVGDAYIDGDVDKVWTDEEDARFGKAVRIAMMKVHDSAANAFFYSIKK